MTVTLYKWTLDRYHDAIDAGLFDDQAVELLRGDIVVMAPEREPHACTVAIAPNTCGDCWAIAHQSGRQNL